MKRILHFALFGIVANFIAANGLSCDTICPSKFPISENNHLRYSDDCNKFCHCANDGNWLKDCPEGLHFNANLQVCDFPWNANCTLDTISETTTYTNEVSTIDEISTTFEPSIEQTTHLTNSSENIDNVCKSVCLTNVPTFKHHYLAYPEECSMFCYCANDGDWTEQCPDGLHFNAELHLCDFPLNANCYSTDKTTTEIVSTTFQSIETTDATTADLNAIDLSTLITTELNIEETTTGLDVTNNTDNKVCDSLCPSEWPIKENIHLPYPGDCTKFCHCANDGNWTKSCPEGLDFNPQLQVCDFPSNALCNSQETTTGQINTITSEIYPNTDSTDSLLVTTIITTETSEVAISTTETNESSKNDTNICYSVCQKHQHQNKKIFLAHPQKCDKYCDCKEDGNELKTCPDKLHFNEDLQVCDFPWIANCTLDTISETTTFTNELSTINEILTTSESSIEQTTYLTNSSENIDNVCKSICLTNIPLFKHHYLSYPEECTMFCYCANDGDWIKTCPDGLHFNAELHSCDLPQNAKCNITDKTTTEILSTTLQNIEITETTITDLNEIDISTLTTTEISIEETTTGLDVSNNTDNKVCNSVCLSEWPIKENIHLPYPGDCTKFCHCANDGNWTKSCPDGLDFNSQLQVCDFPSNALCNSQETTTSQMSTIISEIHPNTDSTDSSLVTTIMTTETPEVAISTTETKESSENVTNICDSVCQKHQHQNKKIFLAHPQKCDKYCDCAEDGNELKTCPDELHFSEDLQVCDFPGIANCSSYETTSTGEVTLTTLELPQSTVDASSTIYPMTTENAEITTEPSENIITVNNSTSICNSVCPSDWPTKENLHLQYPGDCTKFCHCANDNNWPKKCPIGLHFNSELQVCDFPWNANCQINEHTTDQQVTTSSETFLDTNVNDALSTVSVSVITGQSTESTIEQAIANSTENENTSNICSSVCLTINSISDSNLLPHPENCAKFCYCANDQHSSEETCPDELHFNPVLKLCDFVWNANCSSNQILNYCDTVCPSSLLKSQNNYFPVPTDCTKFCHCANDRNWMKSCPGGLHFNRELNVCDYPRNAKCKI